MPPTLRPTLDIVFKALFAEEENRDLLLALLNAVLQPRTPIERAVVANPELPRDVADERGIVLDILAEHADGTRTNVEMQADDRGGSEQRALFHWARVYGDGLQRGQAFTALRPCRVIFILGYRLRHTRRMHSVFLPIERQDGVVLHEDFQIHTLELPRVAETSPVAPAQARAYRWMQFLAAKTDEDRQRIAMFDPDIAKADEVLRRISSLPRAQWLAKRAEENRLLDEIGRRLLAEEAAAEAAAKARAEALVEGRVQGLQTFVVQQITRRFGVDAADAARALGHRTEEDLSVIGERLFTAQTLEELLGG